MKKLSIIIFTTCFLIVPVLAHAQTQTDQLLNAIFGTGGRAVSLDRITVSQMEMMPDSLRDDQPVTFRAIIANNSNQDVSILIAVVNNDRVVTQLNDVYLRPGSNKVDFPETRIQFSSGEQRCFTVETNIDRRWVPITMATAFCPASSRRDQGVGLSVEKLQMTPDPALPGQEVSFVVRIKNDGKKTKGNIHIVDLDSDQIVAQTNSIRIPSGVSSVNIPSSRYTFQRMDTCFTVTVNLDQTSRQIDATEEYCANPTAWTLKPRAQ